MSRPLLALAVNWDTFQRSVLAVLEEALRRLSNRRDLPRQEDPINLELWRLAVRVHNEMQRSGAIEVPFAILLECNNQPIADDIARCARLAKRPDLTCVITNAQAVDFDDFQLYYCIECKRLGSSEGTWILNDNYSLHGISRFADLGWQYGKGCESATMIGYIQNMDLTGVIAEVNVGVSGRGFPALALSSSFLGVHVVDQGAL